MTSGSIAGGAQGVTVQAGACLQASDLTIVSVKAAGVEVKDEGSSLTLTSCQIHEFSSWVGRSVGVHVHSGSSAHLSLLSISGMRTGVFVHQDRTSANLAESTINACEAVCLTKAATGLLDR